MKTITLNGVTYTQVQKRTAQRLFENGTQVYMIGNNTNPYGNMGGLAQVLETFETSVNSFLYYLPRELGTYAHFYTIVE